MCAMLCGTEPMHLGILRASPPPSQIYPAFSTLSSGPSGPRSDFRCQSLPVLVSMHLLSLNAKISHACDVFSAQST